MSEAAYKFVRVCTCVGQKRHVHFSESVYASVKSCKLICWKLKVDLSKAACKFVKKVCVELQTTLSEAACGFVVSCMWINQKLQVDLSGAAF